MREWNLSRFFIEGNRVKVGGTVKILDKDRIKHITGSLRLGVGAKLELCFDDSLECIGEIIEVNKNFVNIKNIENCEIAKELPTEIDLFQGVPKLKKIDLIVQKTVECGVHSVTPVNMTNCVANIKDEKKGKKTERLQKISQSAAEQCKRLYIPRVNEAVDFNEMLSMLKDYDLVILADEDLSSENIDKSTNKLKSIEKDILQSKKIAIIVGSEGGISPEERESLKEISHSVSLGSRILRTETAGIFLLAQLSYILS